jgi:hypothetical protein
MPERLLIVASALGRIVLVLAAFGLAVGSIGLSSVRGFCPEVDEQALAMPALATIVDPDAEQDDPLDQELDQELEGTEAPAEGDGTEGGGTEGEGAGDDAGACPGGVQRCLPPMFSSVLILGDTICNEQAGTRLRRTLVPAFVGSTVLLAGAWWLRPSRLHAPDDQPSRTRT